MKQTIIAVLVVGASCGGPSHPAELAAPMVGVGANLPGYCVTPGTKLTRAIGAGVGKDGRVTFCRDDGDENVGEGCRAVDLANGQMTEVYLTISGEEYDKPGAVVQDDGRLLVCWGQLSCLNKAPAPYEKWLAVQLVGNEVAALSASTAGDRRWVSILDHALTQGLRFEVAPGASTMLWRDKKFFVTAAEGAAVHGFLYAADGSAKGEVGVVGGARPLDLGKVTGPVDLGPGTWAFLAADAAVVAAHDLGTGDAVRVDLGGPQPVDSASMTEIAGGKLAVVLGGTRFGEVVIIDVGSRVVQRWPATPCPPGEAP